MIQAKMKVHYVISTIGRDEISLSPTYSTDPADPNYSYSLTRPNGEFKLTITNPDMIGKFKEGQIYLINVIQVVEVEEALSSKPPLIMVA